MKSSNSKFQSDHQNFWQLASIQSATIGLAIIIGKQLSAQYGPGTAICSIVMGNLILWLIAIAIISMVDRQHANAIENIKTYTGKYGGIAAALIFICAIMNWYAVQINFTMIELTNLFKLNSISQKDLVVRFGAALGLFTALLSIGGIKWLRRFTVYFLPFMLCYICYSLWISSKSITLQGTWGLSTTAVLISILNLLPGVISFPTFFRHSLSKAHSFLALTILTIFISFFEISTIWMDFTFPPGPGWIVHLTAITVFLILGITLCNFFNIYLVSACWELIVPHLSGGKEYAIIGLLGTLTYTFIQISTPELYFQDLTNAYIAILGVVLLMSYLIRLIVRHRPRPFEKAINLAAWGISCIISTIYETQHFLHGIDALLAGVNASILFYLIVIFIEETIWAVRKKIEMLN